LVPVHFRLHYVKELLLSWDEALNFRLLRRNCTQKLNTPRNDASGYDASYDDEIGVTKFWG